MMGDTGPCGPCSEIFYDHGEAIDGGPPGSKNEDGDRFIEIWNLVFMQYNRDEKGKMHRLPKPSVDTGMGLERITAVLQNVHSNYDIDIFSSLIKEAAKLSKNTPISHPSLRVLSDHIRATSFLIGDGVMPANEGRGYVLRRIIRRAIRHGYKLGIREPFFYKLVEPLNKVMGSAFNFSKERKQIIIDEIHLEEQNFFETIENGMAILDKAVDELKLNKKSAISGQVAFKLHDTYGFPLDLTADVCRENNITINTKEFDNAMAKQKNMARSAGNFKAKVSIDYSGPDTIFLGYENTSATAKLVHILKNDQSVENLKEKEKGILILDQTPFYAESGGQIGDKGIIIAEKNEFEVTDTLKIKGNIFAHIGCLNHGQLNVNDKVTANINVEHRQNVMRNHSATHLLHKALKKARVVASKDQVKNAYMEATNLTIKEYSCKSYYLHESFFLAVFKSFIELLGGIAKNELNDWYIKSHRECIVNCLELKTDCISVLKTLKKKGVYISIVSNIDQDMLEPLIARDQLNKYSVSYTHLTLPTNREV